MMENSLIEKKKVNFYHINNRKRKNSLVNQEFTPRKRKK
jgi:hypothetical protein